jgi:adenosine deaminase
MSTDLQSFIRSIPKCELHVHLEGTLEPSQARMFASRNKLEISEDLGSGDQEGYPFHDLPSFLKIYFAAMACLTTSADFSDLVYAYLAKASSQNVIHAEMFFDPQAHTSRGIEFETVLSGLVHGTQQARSDFGISTGLIMCFLRDHTAESADKTLASLIASPNRNHVMGVGLDSDEAGNPPVKFAAAYAQAKEAGFRLTMHCDVDQVNSIEHIRQAVRQIGVERIDHGTNVVEDPELVDEIEQKGIGLTCCPISNSIVCSDFKGKEMKYLLERGVKVTINSDDPAYFNGYMTENLAKMLEAGLGKDELVKTQRNAFEISWVGAEEKTALLSKLDTFLKGN